MTTIKNCDNILVLDQGRVVEEGSHERLLEDNPFGIYALMLQQQMIEDEKAKSEPPGLESMPRILEEEKTPVHSPERREEPTHKSRLE